MRNALAMSFSLGLSFWTLYFAIVPTLVEGQCYCDEVEGSGLFGFFEDVCYRNSGCHWGDCVYVYGSCDDDEVGIRDDSCSWGRHKDWCCPIVPCEERRSPPPPASVPSTTSSDSCPSISESECRIACNGNMYWGDQNGFGTCTCFPGGKVCGSASSDACSSNACSSNACSSNTSSSNTSSSNCFRIFIFKLFRFNWIHKQDFSKLEQCYDNRASSGFCLICNHTRVWLCAVLSTEE